MKTHYQIKLNGSFPGRGFRFYTYLAAKKLSVKGAVFERDGNIVIEAEGEKKKLEDLIECCLKGNSFSTPASIEITEKPLAFYKEFIIL